MFKIGDKVKLVTPYMAALNTGIIGKVICFNGGEYNPIGIEWESEDEAFHSCAGKGKYGYCYYVSEDCIELVKEELKLEDLVSGEWYEVKSNDNRNVWLFKFDKTVQNKVYTFKSCPIEENPNYYENSWWGNLDSIVEIKLAEKSLVKKYFPDEFKEDIETIKLIKGSYYVTEDSSITAIFKPITINSEHTCNASYVVIRGSAKSTFAKSSDICYKTTERNFRPATLEEIDWLDKCIQAGKFVEKDEPQYSFYIKYSPDFTEDLFDKLVHWCNTNMPKNLSWFPANLNTFISFKNCKYFRVGDFTDKPPKYFSGVSNNYESKTEYSIQQVKDLIGYVEPKEVIPEYVKVIDTGPAYYKHSKASEWKCTNYHYGVYPIVNTVYKVIDKNFYSGDKIYSLESIEGKHYLIGEKGIVTSTKEAFEAQKVSSQDNLVGRYLKALVDNPQCIDNKKGSYFLITGYKDYSFYITDIAKNVKNLRASKSNIGTVWELMPEGFKPEEPSKFIVGKWYKHKDNNSGYLKFLRQESRDLRYSERIWANNTYEKKSGYASWNFKDVIEVDLSEIQQYLPDGHPDKFPKVVIPEETSQDFKVGDWVVIQPEKFKDSFYKNVNIYSKDLPVKPLQIKCFSNNGHKNEKHKYLRFNDSKYDHPIDCFRKATLQEVLDATNLMFKNYPLTLKEYFKPSENSLADELPVMVKAKKPSKSVIQVNNQPELVLVSNKKKTNKFNLIIN